MSRVAKSLYEIVRGPIIIDNQNNICLGGGELKVNLVLVNLVFARLHCLTKTPYCGVPATGRFPIQ